MVQLERNGNNVVFEMKGLHKLWALKGRLEIPLANICGARKDSNAARGWKGWRAPGTYVPGLITAGTFYRNGRRVFWDVCNANKTVVVDLKDEDYHQLVIEVSDPDAAVKLLTPDALNP